MTPAGEPLADPELLPPEPPAPAAPSRLPLGGLLLAGGALAAALAAGLLAFGGDSGESLGGKSLGGKSLGGTPPDLASLALPRSPESPIVAPLDTSDPGVLERALAELRIAPELRAKAREEVLSGELKLGLVTLWDRADPDRDAVTIASGGFAQAIEVLNQPVTFVVPYRGLGDFLIVSSLRDGGGGGVTIAVATMGQPLMMSPLGRGQSTQIRIP